MDCILHRDARKLVDDTERIRRDLVRLEQDFSSWAREREENDLATLMEDLKKVEIDVSMMTTDCVFAGQHSEKDAPTVIFHELHQTFVYLDALFNDLKKARLALQDAYIHRDLITHLEIDCGRFTKTVGQIRRYLDGS